MTHAWGGPNRQPYAVKATRSTKASVARRSLKRIRAPAAATWPPHVRLILTDLMRSSGVSLQDLIGDCRISYIARTRQEAMALLRAQVRADGSPPYSFAQIGRYLGGRHHTTILHGVRKHLARAGA